MPLNEANQTCHCTRASKRARGPRAPQKARCSTACWRRSGLGYLPGAGVRASCTRAPQDASPNRRLLARRMLARRLLPRLAGARGRLAALPPLQPGGNKEPPPLGEALWQVARSRSAHGTTGGWKLGKPPARPPPPPPPPPKRVPDKTTFWSLVAANAGVYGLWQVLPPEFMIRHFLLTEASLSPGQVHTLFLAPFSHVSLVQLCGSLLSLWAFGHNMCTVFGPKMVHVYILGGAASSFAHVLWARTSMLHLASETGEATEPAGGAAEGAGGAAPLALRPKLSVACGASGATSAFVAFESLTVPISSLLGTPMPTWWLGALWLAPDIYGAFEGTRGRGNTAHVANLCCAAVGAAAHLAWKFRIGGRW